MKPIKCSKCGFFYDADTEVSCPHCRDNNALGGMPGNNMMNGFDNNPPQQEPAKTKKEHKHLFSRTKSDDRKSKRAAKKGLVDATVSLGEPTNPQQFNFNNVGVNNPQTNADFGKTAPLYQYDAQPASPIAPTVPLQQPGPVPTAAPMQQPNPVQQAAPAYQPSSVQSSNDDDMKTVAFYNLPTDSDPVVGWLVCLKGEYIGESFNVVGGRNTIGRALTNNIALAKEKTVAREKHVAIIFEPNNKQFFAQPLEGCTSYLNGTALMTSCELKDRDVLGVGDAEFMFVKLCSDDFSWDNYI